MTKFTRRDFLKLLNRFLAASGLAALLGPGIAYFYPPKLEEMPSEPVLVGREDEFPIGQSKTVKFGRYPAIVIRLESGLKAYSAVCTHFACVVTWENDINQIACPCHAGFFDPRDGSVISGPPPIGLPLLETKIEDGEIYLLPGGEA